MAFLSSSCQSSWPSRWYTSPSLRLVSRDLTQIKNALPRNKGYVGLFPLGFVAAHLWPCALVGGTLGCTIALLFYVKGKLLVSRATLHRAPKLELILLCRLPPHLQEPDLYAVTVGMATPSNKLKAKTVPENGFFYDFWTGLEFNPRFSIGPFGPFDGKMYLYLVGAVLLEFILISAASLQVYTTPNTTQHNANYATQMQHSGKKLEDYQGR